MSINYYIKIYLISKVTYDIILKEKNNNLKHTVFKVYFSYPIGSFLTNMSQGLNVLDK